jgi:uncharacterized protein DUF2325
MLPQWPGRAPGSRVATISAVCWVFIAAQRVELGTALHDAHAQSQQLRDELAAVTAGAARRDRGRADGIFFPVDCVSHDAVTVVQRLCRQTGKPYLPQRSTSLKSFIAALHRFE